MIKEGRSPQQAVRAMPRKLQRLYLSAYQSSLFDRLLDMRLATMEQVWTGDLAYKHSNGTSFPVTDAANEQQRADAFEISATAPLYGYKVRLAGGAGGMLERSLLDKERLTLEAFRLPGGLAMEGERRPLRVPILEPGYSMVDGDLVLSFSLPKGSFATTVLAEVMKTEITA
jgi:tRNA pseudouridine13 synthase